MTTKFVTVTEDEVFAEFYFTTIVVPVWRKFPDYLEISQALNAYYQLPGSKPNRLAEFVMGERGKDNAAWIDKLFLAKNLAHD